MKKTLSYILTALVLLLVAASIGTSVYVCGYRNGRKAAISPVKTVTDTLVVRDTIRLEKPVEIEKRTVDTMLVSVTDTLRLRDTLYLSLPREEKTYRDSTYMAVVSGYRPSLDRIEIYRRTVTVTTDRYIEAPRWSFGVSAGPGVLLDHKGQPHLGVGAVIGVHYRF